MIPCAVGFFAEGRGAEDEMPHMRGSFARRIFLPRKPFSTCAATRSPGLSPRSASASAQRPESVIIPA